MSEYKPSQIEWVAEQVVQYEGSEGKTVFDQDIIIPILIAPKLHPESGD